MDTPALHHICTRADLAAAEACGYYRAASLESEGFLHCCYRAQLSGVLDRWFKGADNIVLLTLDTTRFDATLVHENTSGGDELFPHVYGAIPLAAITERQDIGLDSTLRRTLTQS